MTSYQDRKPILRQLANTPRGAQFTCSSASMEPTIAVGQVVEVHAVPPCKIRIGDVVVFEGEHDYILHRVVLLSPRRTWFLHVGDGAIQVPPRRALCAWIVGRVPDMRRVPPGSVYWRAVRKRLLG